MTAQPRAPLAREIVYRRGMRVSLGAAGVVLGTGIVGGLLTTELAEPGVSRWWWPALVRVAWIGGGAALTIAAARRTLSGRDHGYLRWMAYTLAGLGLWLCVNPALDLLQGPLQARGALAVTTWETDETTRSEAVIEPEEGPRVVFAPAVGDVARLQACDGERSEVVLLRHTGKILALRCAE